MDVRNLETFPVAYFINPRKRYYLDILVIDGRIILK
jgi:hypothetical protein